MYTAISCISPHLVRRWLFVTTSIAVVAAALMAGTALGQEVDPNATMMAGEAAANMEAGAGDFGQALINFVTYGNYEAADKSSPSMLGTIARILCAIALFMMAALSVIGGTTYVIQTANKGVPGGQIISSFWTPLRISVATILLVPFPGGPGFSTLQLGVTKIAEVGNAHGGWLTREGIDHFVHYGAYQPPLMRDNSAIALSLVASEMCMAHVNASQKKTVVTANYTIVGETHTYSYDYTPQSKKGMKKVPNFCGGVTITIPKSESIDDVNKRRPGAYASGSLVKDIANAERAASQNIAAGWKPLITGLAKDAATIAANLTSDSAALKNLQSGTGSAENFKTANANAANAGTNSGNALRALQSRANRDMQRLVASSVSVARSSLTEERWPEEVGKLGWTALGTIYWQQSHDQKMINTIAGTMAPASMPSEMTGDFENDKRFHDLQARLADLIVAAETAAASQPKEYGEIVSITEAGSDGEGWFKSWVAGLTQGVMRALTTDDNADFVNKMQSTGHTITTVADLTIHGSIWVSSIAAGAEAAGIFIAERVTEAASGIPVVGKFVSAAASPAGGAAVGLITGTAHLFQSYATLAKQFVLPLIVAGFMLAIVLPTIPLFFWLMGVVSWILFYIECLLVSPFWLAAHGTAEKEGWGTEHTRQGYMLMIGLYLNPILRVAGFFAILVVLYPLGVLVTWLSSYLEGVLSTGFLTSPFLLVGSMLVLAFFAYSVAVRVFSLPNELFERGLRWLNGGQEVTGDEGGAHRVNAMMASFNQKGENAQLNARLYGAPTATPPGASPSAEAGGGGSKGGNKG